MVPESMRTRITDLAARMRRARSKEALAAIIAGEVATYTLYDLAYIRAALERELRYVPPHYRAKLEPKVMEHLFGVHHTIMAGYRTGKFNGYQGPIQDKLVEFCDMLLGLPGLDEDWDLRHDLLYYLIEAFTLFVCDLPGHPVGTPFPGGFIVEKRDGVYYCPVREKEDDVKTSICPFCPARQSVLPGDEPLREADA
jgi:uncharacterized protein (UPF0305 family)